MRYQKERTYLIVHALTVVCHNVVGIERTSLVELKSASNTGTTRHSAARYHWSLALARKRISFKASIHWNIDQLIPALSAAYSQLRGLDLTTKRKSYVIQCDWYWYCNFICWIELSGTKENLQTAGRHNDASHFDESGNPSWIERSNRLS